MAGRPPGDSADGKQRLLDACWSLLAETPQGQKLTIAAVCERAKCTPPTLYHHFGDLATLERAASRRAFLTWSNRTAGARQPTGDARDRLVEHAQAYVAWAQNHPDAYNALFSQPRRTLDAETAPLNEPSFRAVLSDLAEIHGKKEGDEALIPLALALWAGVHGVASLATTLPFFPDSVQESTLEIMTKSIVKQIPSQAPGWTADMVESITAEPTRLRPAS